ncbi:MAG: hypothetical protein ACI8VW_000945 [bacterium]|jgi:hypothetical protein
MGFKTFGGFRVDIWESFARMAMNNAKSGLIPSVLIRLETLSVVVLQVHDLLPLLVAAWMWLT